MLVVKIKGGLGNQMFEYAMARKLQMTYQLGKIGLDLTIISKDSIRDYGLDCFQLPDNVEIIENKNKIVRTQEIPVLTNQGILPSQVTLLTME